MRKDLFFLVFKSYLKRMTRDIFGLFIFTILPLIIIFILSSVYKYNSPQVQYVNGYNMTTTFLSVGMMLMFSNAIFLISNFIVGKAFAVATAIVFGGAALVFGMVASKLELHSVRDFNYVIPTV